MNDSSEVIKFEEILKRKARSTALSLYNHSNVNNKHNVHAKPINPEDVISNVTLQLRAIQKAEVSRSYKIEDRKRLNKYNKSNFLPVNMLLSDVVPQSSTACKLETQFMLDTQLMDIIDNAQEFVDPKSDISHEFNNAFQENFLETKHKQNHDVKQIDCCSEEQTDNRITTSSADSVLNTNCYENNKITDIVVNSKTLFNDNNTQMLNNCIEVEANVTAIDDFAEDIEIPCSYVFKPQRICKTPPPLIFDLNTFEDFEKLANPIIEEHRDLKVAKHMINSQIVGRQLCINTDEHPLFAPDYAPLSPVLKITADKLRVTPNKEVITISTLDKDQTPVQEVMTDSIFLKDEILFSSDEESDYVHKDIQDLPLTCALETSFYNDSKVLDKTMYVAFHTASNRSIQVCTESFTKAKSLMDCLEDDDSDKDDGDVTDKVTFTELVDMCDSSTKPNCRASTVNTNGTNISTQANFNLNITPINKDLTGTNENCIPNDIGNRNENMQKLDPSIHDPEIEQDKDPVSQGYSLKTYMNPVKRKFDGFMTASYKKIKLSKLALARSKRVFQDIDIHDNFQSITETTKTNKNDEEKVNIKALDQIDEDIINEFALEMPLTENSVEKVSNEIEGFKIASKKNICISKATISRTKKVFEGIDVNEQLNVNSTTDTVSNSKALENRNVTIKNKVGTDINVTDFAGFKTASNKSIKISKEAIEKSKNILEDIASDIQTCNTSNRLQNKSFDWDQPSTSKVSFCGFRTAKNHKIKMSSEVFKNVISSDLKQFSKDTIVGVETAKNVINKVFVDTVAGKQDALRNNVQDLRDKCNSSIHTLIDNELEEVNKLQNEMCDDFNTVFDNEQLDVKEVIPKLCGFKTASNKTVNISEKAISESKKLFADLNDENDIIYEKKIVNLNSKSSSENITSKQKSHIKKSETYSDQTCLVKDNENKIAFPGFKTASNKKVVVSEKALVQSKKLFGDLKIDIGLIDDKIKSVVKESLQEIKENSIASTSYTVEKEKPIPMLQLFRTDSNKSMEVSEEALAKSEAIFKDIESNERSIKDFNKGNSCTEESKTFKSFETANKKPIKISVQAMERSKSLFKDIDNDDSTLGGNTKDCGNYVENPPVSISKAPIFRGFQTASKKPVKISEEALFKSKLLFKDINIDESTLGWNSKDCKNPVENPVTSNAPIFKGFQTASKKPVKISEEALVKSKMLLKDIDIDDSTLGGNSKDHESLVGNPIININKEPIFRGFQTANKKPVNVSEEALVKSKLLFKDIDIDDSTLGGNTKDYGNSENPVININKEPVFKGFQTVIKKSVEISKEALVNSKLLFKDFDDKTAAFHNAELQFQGFKTANNNVVSVSDEALLKSKKVFEDIQENDHQFVELKEKEIEYAGFRTANEKKVSVSEKALKQCQHVFQDINNDLKSQTRPTEILNDKNIDSNLHKTPLSFKSANNHNIEVSKSALLMSRKFFTENCNTAKGNSEIAKKQSTKLQKNNLEKLIDTQVINNFEETLCTEDFCKTATPKQSKRSGSPILSCPKAKKRKKFETPYRNNVNPKNVETPKTTSKHETQPQYDCEMLFSDNYKKNKRYTLKELAAVEKINPKTNTSLCFNMAELNLDTLLNFKFTGKRNDVTNSCITIDDIKVCFLNAVNKKLVPEGWLDNHLKLIIWKLLSYEVFFPNTLYGVCTVRNVLDQLKFRYDKELYNAERPALRKILEKDDVASKTMMLCVAGIYVDGVCANSVTNVTSTVELLLTDGWYSLKTTIDKMLTKLVYDERISVGSKIVTNGAELVNCEQGVSPWEDTSSVRLKINGNSTRPARWDVRLGYHSNVAILAPLSSVKPEGGKVSKLRVYVARVYPALYVEKFEDGSTVTRSERLENLHQFKCESERQTAMEKLYEEVEKELSEQESQDTESSFNNQRMQFAGSQIVSKSLEELQSKRRERILQKVQTKLHEKMEQNGLHLARNVVSLLKVRVAGVRGSETVEFTKGLMSIWKPNDAITEIVKEGVWIEVMNVMPTAIRYSEIQISAGHHSIFRESKFKGNEKVLPHVKLLHRKCYPIKELAENPTLATDYNEIDTAGFILQIDPTTADFESSKQLFQNLYLVDAERNIVCVNFWGGLKKFGYNTVLDTGQVVACINLQKRTGNTKKSIPHYRVTEFSYFTKTPKNVNARNMVEELVEKFTSLDKRKFIEECIFIKNNFSALSNVNNENISPYRINNYHNLSKNRIFIDSPLAKKPVDDNLNLTGLDFESTFKQDTQEFSPQALLRKKKVNEKIAKLKMYGEPPALSPIHIINKSSVAYNSYRSPLTSNANVASVKKINENSRNDNCEIQSSPVISLNRTYVKTVNPVKLNFSSVQDNSVEDEVDHFAEDFDGSPPLSLE